MPTIDPNSPRTALTVKGVTVQAPQPYAEGAILTALEASFLNKSLASVVANGFSTSIANSLKAGNEARAEQFKAKTYTGPLVTNDKGKEVPADFTVADIEGFDAQSQYDARFSEYVVGASNRGSSEPKSTDPVAKFAHSIALEQVKKLLAAKGKKFRDVQKAPATDAKFKNKVDELIAAVLSNEAYAWIGQLAQNQADAMAAHSDGSIEV